MGSYDHRIFVEFPMHKERGELFPIFFGVNLPVEPGAVVVGFQLGAETQLPDRLQRLSDLCLLLK